MPAGGRPAAPPGPSFPQRCTAVREKRHGSRYRAVGRRKNAVIPAKAGIHADQGTGVKPLGAPPCVQGAIAALVDSGLRRKDGVVAGGLHCARPAVTFSSDSSVRKPESTSAKGPPCSTPRHAKGLRAGIPAGVDPGLRRDDGVASSAGAPFGPRSRSPLAAPRLRGDDQTVGRPERLMAQAPSPFSHSLAYRHFPIAAAFLHRHSPPRRSRLLPASPRFHPHLRTPRWTPPLH